MGDWPPLAYALAMGFGFTVMYLSAAVAFVSVWHQWYGSSCLPCVKAESGDRYAGSTRTGATLLLFIICTLMWGTNSLYIINMPLFIIDELHLPEKLAGIMMGTAAGPRSPPC